MLLMRLANLKVIIVFHVRLCWLSTIIMMSMLTICSHVIVDIQHEQEEFGIDLQYNSIPTLCYYEYLTEGESDLDGDETRVSSHFNEIYDKDWLLLFVDLCLMT